MQGYNYSEKLECIEMSLWVHVGPERGQIFTGAVTGARVEISYKPGPGPELR